METEVITRDLIANTYLNGAGIEIGALHNPLKVPGHVRVRYVDRMPVEELRNQLRVLNPTGILYLAIPDKRYTFDINRPVTSFEHMVKDYEEGPEWFRINIHPPAKANSQE